MMRNRLASALKTGDVATLSGLLAPECVFTCPTTRCTRPAPELAARRQVSAIVRPISALRTMNDQNTGAIR
jgi:hypothetical protein